MFTREAYIYNTLAIIAIYIALWILYNSIKIPHYIKLVGGFNASEKYWSVGIIIPYIMESHKIHVPNHQSVVMSIARDKKVLK